MFIDYRNGCFFVLINQYFSGKMGNVLLRVLSDTNPTERARVVAPTLEDYYLHVFGDAAGT